MTTATTPETREHPLDSTVPAVAPLALTTAAAVTPAGLGLGALGAALDGSGPEASRPAGEIDGEALPPRPTRAVPDVDFAELLGRKGLRNLDRTTRLALVACRLAVDAYPGRLGHDTGTVWGTTAGSVRSSSEYSRRTLTADPPYLVNPSLFPNTVMNCAAGQVAIRHQLHGVNATLAGGPLAGVQAVRYARNAVRQVQVERLLVGGVEELSAQGCWGWHRSGGLRPHAAVGEGAAVLVLEQEERARREGRPLLARVLAAEVGFAERGRLVRSLAAVVTHALRRSGRSAAEVTTVSFGATHRTGLDRAEERAVRRVLADREPQRAVHVNTVVGECSAATGALQLAALLADWRRAGAAAGEVALVPALSADGSVGCLVVQASEGLSQVRAPGTGTASATERSR